jgi:hypothetical protein
MAGGPRETSALKRNCCSRACFQKSTARSRPTAITMSGFACFSFRMIGEVVGRLQL